MTLREAAEQALEALEDPWSAGVNGVADAIIALRAALAEPDEVAAEREACAEIMESNAKACNNQSMLYEALMAGAAAIRARGAYEAETL